MRAQQYFVVLEGLRRRGGRIEWSYAYMAKGVRAAKAALKEEYTRVFRVDDKGNLFAFRP